MHDMTDTSIVRTRMIGMDIEEVEDIIREHLGLSESAKFNWDTYLTSVMRVSIKDETEEEA